MKLEQLKTVRCRPPQSRTPRYADCTAESDSVQADSIHEQSWRWKSRDALFLYTDRVR